MTTRDTLTSALTQYDLRASKRKGHDPYALGIYFQRVDDVMVDIENGADIRAAVVAGFTRRLADACLRALGLAITTDDEARGGMKHTPTRWKVLPCPNHAGKHPYRDHRWIATEDAEVEHAPDVRSWVLEKGSLICEMRDVDTRYAHLIAAAPELLASLRRLLRADERPPSEAQAEEAIAAMGEARALLQRLS